MHMIWEECDWLLDSSKREDYQGVVFVSKNSQLLGENVDSLGENGQTLGENGDSLEQKESKVKDSRGKQSTRARRPK